MEMGGGIMLAGDGRFLYQIAYGALDETAEGNWTCDSDTIFLTSDPVTPPRFAARSVPLSGDVLEVALDLPDGMSPQYFSVLVRYSDGSIDQIDFRGETLTIPYAGEVRPVFAQPLLEIYGLTGDPIALPESGGLRIDVHFTPNDLGKIAFANTPLTVEGDRLLLSRFGATIPFERAAEASTP